MLPKVPSIKVLEPLEFFSEFINDIKKSEKEILIFSPFIGSWGKAQTTYKQVIKALKDALKKGDKVKVVIDKKTIKEPKIKELHEMGVEIYARETHVKVVVIDGDKIMYLGSLNPLSYWGKDDIMIRVEGGPIVRREIRKALDKIRPPEEEERLDIL